MSAMDLLKGMSELDEKWIVKPKRYMSLRMNILLCFLAGQISSWVPVRSNIVQVAVYFLAFGGLYSAVMLWINRNRKQTLLIDHENGA